MKPVLFLLVFAIHAILQFLSWSMATNGAGYKTAWLVLSSPVFWIGAALADRFFWLLMLLNSSIWAGVIVLVAHYAIRSHRQ